MQNFTIKVLFLRICLTLRQKSLKFVFFSPRQPELTVENLPSFLSLGKALLLLFVGEEEDEIGRRQNQELLEEMRRVVEVGGARAEPYLACWIHLYVLVTRISLIRVQV